MIINFTFWLVLCLCLSIIGNILSFWYIRKVLARLSFINENIDDLSELIGAYQNHLSGIFSLEQYYGDDDIKFLLEHTRGLKEVLEEYSEVSALLEPPSDDADEEQQEDEEEYAAPPIDEENVFYAGTRASNN